MKRMVILMIVAAIILVATQAMAVTFPTLDNHTLVSSDGNGVIVVKAAGETNWVLIQFCQDDLRAGAPNNITVEPFEVYGNTMKFQLDQDGIADGQVAFNFRNKCLSGTPWLAIPDCRVKTAGMVGMGTSHYIKDISESGGAHFTYTGSGIEVFEPIDASQWCDEGKLMAPIAEKVYAPAPAKTFYVPAGKGMTLEVVKSPDAQTLQTKQVGGIVKVKGNNNKTVTVTTQKKTVIQQKGPTVKDVKGNVCIYNPQIIVNSAESVPNECLTCHSDAKIGSSYKDLIMGCRTTATTTTSVTTTIKTKKK